MSKKEEGKIENEKNKGNEVQSEKAEVEKKEIDKIRSDVDKLSQELRTAVTDLKKSIVDIRSAVSEIENPFNLLRVISSEKDLKKLNSERLPPGVKSLVLGRPEKESEEKVEEKPIMPQPLQEEVPKAEVLEAKPTVEEQIPSKPELKPSGTVYLDWVWSLLDLGFSPDDVRQLAQSYERLGFLPEGASDQVYSLAIAAEKAKSKGLTRSRLLLNMYEASVLSGIKIGIEDVKRLISIAESRTKRTETMKRDV
ncbi:MAG: hypothetical protein ACPLRY_07865 [Candidatus Bathyarchaeales archaeon]